MRHAKSRRERVDDALRILAAVPGGYALAASGSMAIARLLPGDRLETTVAATVLAFALCAATVMWAYAARSGWRALWTVMLAVAVAGAIVAASVHLTGRA